MKTTAAPFMNVSLNVTADSPLAREPHWADRDEIKEARRLGDQSRIEYWMYLVACYVVNCTEEMAREIAAIALRDRGGVWHATWIYRGRQPGQCGCAACYLPTSDPRHPQHDPQVEAALRDDRLNP